MPTTRINDLSSASSATTSMQMEVDTGGVTSEKISMPQLLTFNNYNRPQIVPTYYYGITFTNLSSTGNIINAGASIYGGLDLTLFTQVRTVARMGVGGSAGTLIYTRYKSGGAYSALYTDFSALTSPESTVDVSTSGVMDSGWSNLVGGAKSTNIWIVACISGGDGVADPNVFSVSTEFR